jgi:phosphoadenosine phosphosulfate reductase
MVKKRLANGDPCEKCAQTEEMLRRRGLWDRVDEVVWALEGDASSAGAELGRRHGVQVAPFFVVRDKDGHHTVYSSPLKMLRDLFPKAKPSAAPTPPSVDEVPALAARLGDAAPAEILRFGLERYGERCAIAFSGAEDVVLIDMATRLDLPFSVLTLDTGRLHADTYDYLDTIRRRYGVAIQTCFPDGDELAELVGARGPNSFFQDGHRACCAVRKVAPLRKALAGFGAWVSGQRRDQSPTTRADLLVVEADRIFRGADTLLLKLNPLAGWTSDQVWSYIREQDVPTNPLHEQGFASIGCEPCSRPTAPGQHPREGRWWWERPEDREAGLHRLPEGVPAPGPGVR